MHNDLNENLNCQKGSGEHWRTPKPSKYSKSSDRREEFQHNAVDATEKHFVASSLVLAHPFPVW